MVKQILELLNCSNDVWEKYGPRIECEIIDGVRDLLTKKFIDAYDKNCGFHDFYLSEFRIISKKRTKNNKAVISVELYLKEYYDEDKGIVLTINKCQDIQTYGNIIDPSPIFETTTIYRMLIEKNESDIITTGLLLSSECIIVIDHQDPRIKIERF